MGHEHRLSGPEQAPLPGLQLRGKPLCGGPSERGCDLGSDTTFSPPGPCRAAHPWPPSVTGSQNAGEPADHPYGQPSGALTGREGQPHTWRGEQKTALSHCASVMAAVALTSDSAINTSLLLYCTPLLWSALWVHLLEVRASMLYDWL